MLEKFSTLPVALPWASCAWKASLRVGAGGLGRLRTAAPVCSPSTSREVSLVLSFFFLRSPRGILPGPTCAASGLLPPWLAPRTLCPAARPLEAGAAWAGPIAEALGRAPSGQGPLLHWEERHLQAERPAALWRHLREEKLDLRRGNVACLSSSTKIKPSASAADPTATPCPGGNSGCENKEAFCALESVPRQLRCIS